MNNPEDPAAGTRQVPFGRELWIERDDFLEEPPPKFFRLAPGREVRLRICLLHHLHGGRQGRLGADRRAALHLRPGDPRRRRAGRPPAEGDAPLGLGGARPYPAEVRLYDHLFIRPDPGADGDLFADLNPASETIVHGAVLSRRCAMRPSDETVQFERLGYFTPDPDSAPAPSSSTGR